ncbi:MAG: hypothetical protein EAZ91_00090 [Cytophagales bacterium]|nr:MAG: hypothetical protein EAZ91_00090 [Cytophagales bacterium]
MLLYNNQLSGCIPNSFSALCGRAVNLVGNSGLPNGGDLGPFCASREGSDLFITVSTSGSVVRSGTSIYLRASGGASYTWTAPIGATLTSPAVASSVTAIVSGDGPRNFTLTATNNYCSQTRVSSVITVMHPDYIPLAEFFAATNGPNWLNKAGWLSSLDPCSGWFGVSCQNGRVSSLSLTANQLRGTLPENLTTLPNLQVLDLSGNQLRGCFPVAWTAFCNRTVSLQNNPNLPGGGDWTGFCSNRLGSADFVTIAKAMPNPVSLGGITSLSASGGTLYQWTGPQNFTSNQSVVSLSVSSGEQQGVYSVTVGNGNMSCSAVATTSLTINGVSCVKLSPLVSSSSICTRGIVTLTVSATSPEAVTFQWYKGATALVNNTATIGATSTTLIMADLPLSATGTYHVVANSGCGSTTSTVFSLSVTPPTHPDYLALADLFYSTKGLLWYNKTNWLTSGDPCSQWAGIYCNENKTRVSNVWLIENGLDGRLPESLSGLTEIGAFNARNNNLTDTIPDCFGWMNQISDVLLNGNQLTGRIPRSLGGRPNLRVLWLQNNQLTGDIPPTMIDSPKLEILSLYNNQLNGNIPGWLGQLPQLFYFDAAFNQLTGSIPTGLSVTKGLTYFSVQGNRLVGSIPRSLSLMLSLQVLNLSFNQLDGTIPEELSALSGLKVLDLGTNRLTGGLPTSFSVLTSLRSLGLNNNQLSGQIPVGWSTMAGLTSLDLSVNQLTGAIPFGMGNMTNLQYFYLSNNQFTSSIPSSLSRLSKLRGLGLQNNQLSGCIPLSLTSLCAQDITVNISNNPGLPGGGNWSAFCATGAGSYAGTLTTTKAGIWTDGSVWSCGAVPQAGDRVIVQHPVTVTPVPLNFVNQVRFEGAGKLIYEAGARLQMK